MHAIILALSLVSQSPFLVPPSMAPGGGTINSSALFGWSGGTTLSSPTGTDLKITDVGGANGFRLRVNDSTSLMFYRLDGSGYANTYAFVQNATGFAVASGGNVSFAGYGNITSTADNSYVFTGSSKGSAFGLKQNTVIVTFPGGGSATQVTSGLIPAGAFLFGVTARVTTTGTVCTSLEIGDGTTADQWCPSGTAITQNTTCGVPKSATSYGPLAAAREATVTSVGSNCQNLVVAITATYLLATAATSN